MADSRILFSTLHDQNQNFDGLSAERDDDLAMDNSEAIVDNGEETIVTGNIGSLDDIDDHANGSAVDGTEVNGFNEQTHDHTVEAATTVNLKQADEGVRHATRPTVDGTVGAGSNRQTDDHNVDAANLEVVTPCATETGQTVDNNDDENRHTIGDEITAKKLTHSKKNRNIKSVLANIKNKIENIQTNNGGSPNYLLILEDNFSDVKRTGPNTTMNRKLLVTTAGNLREDFKAKTVGYDPEKMIVMKKGKHLEGDFSFLDEYIKDRTSPSALNQVIQNPTESPFTLNQGLQNLAGSPGTLNQVLQNPAGSPGTLNQVIQKLAGYPAALNQIIQNPAGCSTPPSHSLVQILKSLARDNLVSNKKRRTRKKKRRLSKVFESSTDDSTDDSSSDSSEEPIRKRRKSRKTKRAKKQKSGHKVRSFRDVVETDESDSDASRDAPIDLIATSEDEQDADPNHGTIQKPKSSKIIPKISAPRHPKERKEKNDILKVVAKKVLTPGTFPVLKHTKAKAKVTPKVGPTKVAPKKRVLAKVAPTKAVSTILPDVSLAIDELETSPINDSVAEESFVDNGDEFSTMPPNLKVQSWLKNQQPGTAASSAKISTQPNQLKPAKRISKPVPNPKTPNPVLKSTKPLLKTSSALNTAQSNPSNFKELPKKSLMARPGPPKVTNKENVSTYPEPGPSGQFRFGRGSILVEESARKAKNQDKPQKPVIKKLFTTEDIEKQLDMDKTPTRKR